MMQSEQINEIAAALAKARAEFKPILKDRKAAVMTKAGKDRSYTYADLGSVLDAVTPALCANGLFVTQGTRWDGGMLFLETKILHSSGQWLGSLYPLATLGSSQEMGSQLTYARRYSLTAMAGVFAEDDDDGAAASQAHHKKNDRARPPAEAEPRITKDQAQAFYDAAKAQGLPFDEVKALMLRVAGVDAAVKIPVSAYDALMAEVQPATTEAA